MSKSRFPSESLIAKRPLRGSPALLTNEQVREAVESAGCGMIEDNPELLKSLGLDEGPSASYSSLTSRSSGISEDEPAISDEDSEESKSIDTSPE